MQALKTLKKNYSQRAADLATPTSAIRAKCVECMGGDKLHIIAKCDATDCPLWPWRMGKRSLAKAILAGRKNP